MLGMRKPQTTSGQSSYVKISDTFDIFEFQITLRYKYQPKKNQKSSSILIKTDLVRCFRLNQDNFLFLLRDILVHATHSV